MTITIPQPEATTNGKPAAHAGALVAHAIRFRQKRPDVNLYVTTLRLKDLLGRFHSDTCEDENPNGYQRPVTSSRLRQLSSYMRDEEGMLPTSILLCIRQPHQGLFEPHVEANGKGEYGTLTIPADVPLWVVDGQHRLHGLERALKKDKAKWLGDYPLPVVIVEGIDAYEEMRYFHVINTRHKGVPTDVVDRHLLSMREAEGAALIEREGEKNYLRGRAAKLTSLLNTDPESPWQGKIRMPGQPLRAEHLMRQHSMVSSLDPVVRDNFVKRLTDEEAGKLLLNYWVAARECWPPVFETPGEYIVQRPLGAGALHQIFPDVLEVCRAADDFTRAKMLDTLSYVGRSAGFWHTGRGHHLVRNSGSRAVRALAEYLRDRLPRPVLRRI
ncbi:MAG TPA: DGQHR domain-containing protein [Dehalococcoidia bacterium]|jgi:DGQHR domain-containing protein|nr:DGQHR domain-containing protein [Dehalococcoidia bacterium]